MKSLFLVPAMLLLAGCAANSYCTGEQPYQKAASVPPLAGTDDLKLPDSAGALKIPPPPAKPVAYGEVVKDKEGDDEIHCLDKPPEMAMAPEAPVAPVAPAAPPVAAPGKVETPPEAVPAEKPAPKKPAAPAKKPVKKKPAANSAAPIAADPATKAK